MLSLSLPETILVEMIGQARAQAPVEACGILAGRDQQVETWYPMANVDRSSEHFMMEPAEQFKVAKAIRQAGFQMLAVYHSHPETPARPSDEDIRLALTPGVVHVILSLQDSDHPVVKGFDIQDGAPVEIDLTVTKVHSLIEETTRCEDQ